MKFSLQLLTTLIRTEQSNVCKIPKTEILYAILAYNKNKITEFNIDLEKQLLNNYIKRHREITQKLYANLNTKMQNQREHIIRIIK